VFDVGGVLCGFRPELRLQALSATTGIDEATILESVWTSGLDSAGDAGEFTLMENLEAIRHALGSDVTDEEILRAWSRAFPSNAAVVEIAMTLRCRSASLSNNGPVVEECVRQGLIELAPTIAPTLYAWRLRAKKPERLAYERAAAAIQALPAELLLVDDNLENVIGALAAGWQALHFTGAPQLASDLAERSLH
jgi:2-haloacid dehalogenase